MTNPGNVFAVWELDLEASAGPSSVSTEPKTDLQPHVHSRSLPLRLSMMPEQDNTGILSTKTPIRTTLTCFHCGEDCPDDRISVDDKFFCCEGCKLVYEILHTHDLTQYYRIDKTPGINRRNSSKLQYAWLDDPDVVSRLADFSDDSLVRLTLRLPQIHCSSCIWLLENLYKLQPGILQSKVNFLKKEAYISIDPKVVSVRQVAEMLASIGYAPELNLQSIDAKKKDVKADKTIYYQLGVAGFAFGNIMLLSFPEYLGLEESRFRQWFGYINILISLPVVFFSARPYLTSAWHGIRKGYLNIDVPLSLGIAALFLRSVYEIIWQSGGGYLDSLAGLIFFLLTGRWFQQMTYHRLSFDRDYKSYFPVSATVLRDGKEDTIALDKLSIGDTLIVRHKELIPADSILLRGNAMLDYSFVTGEADPVAKQKGDKVYAGGRQVGDAIELTVIKKVSNSYLTQLWNDAAFTKEDHGQTASLIADKLGRRFTIVILVIAFASLIYWLPQDTALAINAFSAVLIIACPCAVALSIPFTLGNVIRIFGRNGFYLKNTNVIERLAKINTIVFDKTGTITQTSDDALQYSGDQLSPEELNNIRILAAQSSHPVSKQIVRYIDTITQETMSFHADGNGALQDYHEEPGKGIRATISMMSVEIRKGSTGGTDVCINGTLRGTFRMRHQYRSGLASLMQYWGQKHQLYLLSGDNDQERKALEAIIPAENLHFNQSPKAKLDFINTLQTTQADAQVMMIGDGLNDAGALQKSHVGVVVAENTNNFTPACDAILDAARFGQLPEFLKLSHKSLRIVYMAYGLAFIYNVIGLSYAVQGTLSPVIAAILMPLSSVTIVLFGVGMSSLAARRLLK